MASALSNLTLIAPCFCKNLHAKRYINNQIGILIQRAEDSQLYQDAYEEAQRIIRISDEVRISLERVSSEPVAPAVAAPSPSLSRDDDKNAEATNAEGKLTSSKIAQKLGLKTAPFLDRATEQGFLAFDNGQHFVSAQGEQAGVELIAKPRFGPYFLWPHDFYLL